MIALLFAALLSTPTATSTSVFDVFCERFCEEFFHDVWSPRRQPIWQTSGSSFEIPIPLQHARTGAVHVLDDDAIREMRFTVTATYAVTSTVPRPVIIIWR